MHGTQTEVHRLRSSVCSFSEEMSVWHLNDLKCSGLFTNCKEFGTLRDLTLLEDLILLNETDMRAREFLMNLIPTSVRFLC